MRRIESSVAAPRHVDGAASSGKAFQDELDRRWREGLVIFHPLSASEVRIVTAAGAVKDRRRRVWLLPSPEIAAKIGFICIKREGRGIFARQPKIAHCPDCSRHTTSGRWKLFDGEGPHETCTRCGALIQLAQPSG